MAIEETPPNAANEIRITWTDKGVYPFVRPEVLKANQLVIAEPFSARGLFAIRADVPPEGQIAVPMPIGAVLPKGDAEWKEYGDKVYAGISESIQKALAKNVRNFEIRSIQDISLYAGYWTKYSLKKTDSTELPDGAQKNVLDYTRAVMSAVLRVKQDLARGGAGVSVAGIMGSNGGYAITESIVRGDASPFDKLVLVDARAYVTSTIDAAKKLNGRVSIVTTAADAPALSDMIANRTGAEKVRAADDRVQWLDIKIGGIQFLGTAHIAVLISPKKSVSVVENGPNGFSTTYSMSAGEFINKISNVESERPAAIAPTAPK